MKGISSLYLSRLIFFFPYQDKMKTLFKLVVSRLDEARTSIPLNFRYTSSTRSTLAFKNKVIKEPPEQLYSYFAALCSLLAITALLRLKQVQLSCPALGTYRHEGDLRVLLGERRHDLVHLNTLRSPRRPEVDNYKGPVKKNNSIYF